MKLAQWWETLAGMCSHADLRLQCLLLEALGLLLELQVRFLHTQWRCKTRFGMVQ